MTGVNGIVITASATPEEVAAALTAITARRAREQPVDNYAKWRRVRQITVLQAKQ